MQESKLGDFEFQSIKLLAFRRAVVAAATAVVDRSSSLPLSLHLSLSFSSRTLSSFSPSPPSAGRPLFSPVSSLPPASNGSFAAEIHTDVSPTPSRTPHSSFSSFLPRRSPSRRFPPPSHLFFPFLFPPFCRGSSSATHESARIHTRVRSRAFSGRSRTHAEYSAP